MRGSNYFVNSYRRMCCNGTGPVGTKPLIEVCGHRRVLIEHHAGILNYDHSQISVKVIYGCVHVHGERLELKLLSKEKLIITGTISSITLQQESAI